MRWEEELFDAAVIHVHSPGKVNAVYGIDGSVCIFLTAEKHGLKLLDEEKKGGGGPLRRGAEEECAQWVDALTKSG